MEKKLREPENRCFHLQISVSQYDVLSKASHYVIYCLEYKSSETKLLVMCVVDFGKGEKMINCLFKLKGMTLLHWSCDRGHTKMVNMLINCRTNINEQVYCIIASF